MDINTLTITLAFVWAIIWVILPDKVLAKRPLLRKIFFGLGIVLGAAAIFILMTRHA